MSHLKCILLFVAVTMILQGCNDFQATEENQAKTGKYFDLAGLISSQVERLNYEQPRVNKKALVDGQEEKLTLDKIDWKKELSLFVKADINKPKLLGRYATNQFANDAGDMVTQYKLNTENVSGIIKMEVVKDPNNNGLKSIFIESCEYNTLYTTELDLIMRFDGLTGSPKLPKLTSYAINGFEKMVMKDTMIYSISGSIE